MKRGYIASFLILILTGVVLLLVVGIAMYPTLIGRTRLDELKGGQALALAYGCLDYTFLGMVRDLRFTPWSLSTPLGMCEMSFGIEGKNVAITVVATVDGVYKKAIRAETTISGKIKINKVYEVE